MPNSRQLKVLSLAVHKTPLALKQWVGLSRTCIQPPTDLHLTPLSDDDENAVSHNGLIASQECLVC